MAVENQKTTWAGYLTLAVSLLGIIADVLSNGAPTGISTGGAAGAITGVGLILAKDGKH